MKMYFLQEDYSNFLAGTPLEEAEPTAAHLQARTCVVNPESSAYYRVIGTTGADDVFMVPRFSGLVDEIHPTDPRRTGPYVAGKGCRVVKDRLPEHLVAKVVWERNYPYMEAVVIMNDKPAEGANDFLVCKPTDVNVFGLYELVLNINKQMEDRFGPLELEIRDSNW